jgi:hypothetical protein
LIVSQAIQFNAVLSRVGTRSDGSLGLTLETGELVPEDKLAVFNLQNVPCLITFKPNDSDATPPREVKGELSKKTQSERIRAALFVFWRQAGEPGSFDLFYQCETEKLLNLIKAKLKPV